MVWGPGAHLWWGPGAESLEAVGFFFPFLHFTNRPIFGIFFVTLFGPFFVLITLKSKPILEILALFLNPDLSSEL